MIWKKNYLALTRREVNSCNIERKERGIRKIENLTRVKKRSLYVLSNVRRGANVDSDHHLVKAGLTVKLTKTGARMAEKSRYYIKKVEEIDCASPEEDIPGTSRYGRSCRSSS